MSPPNEADTPANPSGTRRAPHNVLKPVVPVLPLGFPQRAIAVSTVKQADPVAPAVVARSQPDASALQRADGSDLRSQQQSQPPAGSAKNEDKYIGAPYRGLQPVQYNGANVHHPSTEPMHQQGTGMKALSMRAASNSLTTRSRPGDISIM